MRSPVFPEFAESGLAWRLFWAEVPRIFALWELLNVKWPEPTVPPAKWLDTF
jgi:hypothetical protein